MNGSNRINYVKKFTTWDEFELPVHLWIIIGILWWKKVYYIYNNNVTRLSNKTEKHGKFVDISIKYTIIFDRVQILIYLASTEIRFFFFFLNKNMFLLFYHQIGTVAGNLLSGLILHSYSWPYVFYVFGGISVIWFLIFVSLYTT